MRLHTMDKRDGTGALWENFCIAERLKFLNYQHQQVNSFFWRTYSPRAIDYIEESYGAFSAFEFKWNVVKKQQRRMSLHPAILTQGLRQLPRIISQTGFWNKSIGHGCRNVRMLRVGDHALP